MGAPFPFDLHQARMESRSMVRPYITVRQISGPREPPPNRELVMSDNKKKVGKPDRDRVSNKEPYEPAYLAKKQFEYIRHGTRTLFAAFNPHTGQLFGECSERRKAVDLMRFMEGVAKQYPTGNVTVVWDNLNIHHGPAWEGGIQPPTRRPLPLPLHAAARVVGEPGRDLVQHSRASGAEARIVPRPRRAGARRRRLRRALERPRGASIPLGLPRTLQAPCRIALSCASAARSTARRRG